MVDLELIFSVFRALMEGPVISKASHVVDPVEALDAVRHTVQLEDVCTLRHWRDSVDLEVCGAACQGNASHVVDTMRTSTSH